MTEEQKLIEKMIFNLDLILNKPSGIDELKAFYHRNDLTMDKGFIPSTGQYWCIISGIRIQGHLTNYDFIIDKAYIKDGYDFTDHNSVICDLQPEVEKLFINEFCAYWKKKRDEME